MSQSTASKDDSLIIVINSGGNIDKINAMICMSKNHQYDNPKLSLDFINNATNLSRIINDKTLEIKALDQYAYLLSGEDKNDSALVKLEEGLTIALANEMDGESALLYHHMAYIYLKNNNYDKAKENFESAVRIFTANSDLKRLGPALNNLGIICYKQAQYEKALEYFISATKIKETILPNGKQIASKSEIASSYISIGNLYWKSNNFKEADYYFTKALKISNEAEFNKGILTATRNLGVLNNSLKNYQKALYYHHQALNICNKNKLQKQKAGVMMSIGNVYVNMKEYPKAINYFNGAKRISESLLDNNVLSKIYKNIGSCHLLMNDYSKAEQNFKNALDLAIKIGDIELQKEIFVQMSENYSLMGKSAVAYDFSKKGIQMSDSIDQINNHTAMVEMQTKYETEKKDIKIKILDKNNKIRLLQIENQEMALKQKEHIINLIIVGVLLLSLIMVLLYNRNQLRHKNQKMELEMKNIEFEGRLLRSQMNPHFIFNSLASIQHYILKNEKSQAIDFLLKFSGLIRNILDLSRKSFVLLKDDLNTIKLYLQLEKLRMKDKFDFEIIIDEEANVDLIYLPPMLMQPYIENAIKHGITQMESKGMISIKIRIEGENLNCCIEDNGIGRKKSAEISLNSEHKSIATVLTAERLSQLNKRGFNNITHKIIDLYDELNNALGTRVVLVVPMIKE